MRYFSIFNFTSLQDDDESDIIDTGDILENQELSVPDNEIDQDAGSSNAISCNRKVILENEVLKVVIAKQHGKQVESGVMEVSKAIDTSFIQILNLL